MAKKPEDLTRQNEALQRENASLKAEIAVLEAEKRAMILQMFGRKSERAESEHNQLVLEGFEQDETVGNASDEEASRREDQLKEKPPQSKRRNKPRVRADVEVKEERVRLEPEEMTCPECAESKAVIRVEESEELDFIPAHVIRRIYERPICACPHCKEYVSQAAPPARPIDKSVAGPGLLAHILVSKYQDHQPLYRLEQILNRHGLEVSRATMSNWVGKCADRLHPLCERKLQEILATGYIQVDETPVKLLDPERPGKARQAWLWVILNPEAGVYFHFSPGRGAKDIAPLLKGFKGVMQTDGLSTYESLYKSGLLHSEDVEHMGCWAHARREFWKATQIGQSEKAGEVVALIQKLYRVEKQTAHLSDEDRLAQRQILAKPVLDQIREILITYQNDPSATPARQLSKGCAYVLNRWDALKAYCDHGHVRIDNNPVENKIRPAALGRKNWLFIGHPGAGWRTSTLYTVMANCTMQNLNHFEYLRDLLSKANPS